MSKNKKEKLETISIKTVRMECQLWSKAILMQISRISRNKNAVDYNKKLQRMADEHFLRISLYKLYEWMNYLQEYIYGIDDYLNEFDKLPDLKLLRDISEHQKQYYGKNGNHQKEFINPNTNQSVLISSVIDHKHFLSGKIDTNKLKKLVEQIDVFFESNKYKLKTPSFNVLNELAEDQII